MKNSKRLLVFFLFVAGWVSAETKMDSGVVQPVVQLAENQDVHKSWRRIFIIRHGQRPDEMDPRLSVLGRKQAELVTERLKASGFEGEIYASPYKRTVETACPAAKFFGKKIRLCSEFQEFAYTEGVPNTPGLTQEQLQEMFPDLIADTPKLSYPWVLSDNVGPRIKKYVAIGLVEIIGETTEDIAIFTHGGQVEAAAEILTENTNIKLDFLPWNCMLCTFLLKADGTTAFIGVTADFMLPDEISNNEHVGLLGVKVPCVMPKKK